MSSLQDLGPVEYGNKSIEVTDHRPLALFLFCLWPSQTVTSVDSWPRVPRPLKGRYIKYLLGSNFHIKAPAHENLSRLKILSQVLVSRVAVEPYR